MLSSVPTAELYKFKPMLGPAEDWPEGSPEWAERVSSYLQSSTKTLSKSTAHYLREHITKIFNADPAPWDIWPDPPFNTPDEYCKEVTGHSWEALVNVVDELTGDTGLREKMQGKLARAQVEHRPQGRHHGNAITVRIHDRARGTNAEYRLRRIARERPDILEAYEQGAFKSVAAAYRAAGFKTGPTRLEKVCSMVLKLMPHERDVVRHLLDKEKDCERLPVEF